ncbi:hypothetical protein CHLNCDRAFT_144881 [Chlorella variabilis]|uniref:Myb-like domain-containing protein n=1 Tax=Chlorella variabilis TaxID=554065 RepID=E1ZD79_CHLVA|nr:hypothetical protein CHLNCDRAFT_144881 [Chlorella variabilis]EFN56170.1 hypothetical protein CHLNCDRAFT_144881 [Chlorella variabilis]|eukprot:XP_005848272.1 hypothetical protein CHLNCDRAFT_144881 [Chlorella variabilis]
MTGDRPQQAAAFGDPPSVRQQPLITIHENDNPNPDSLAAGHRRKRRGGGGDDPLPPSAARPRQQSRAGSAAAALAAGAAEHGDDRPAKRQRTAKAVAQAALALAEQMEAAEDEETGEEAAAPPAPPAAARPRQRRQRVLVDVHGGVGMSAAGRQQLEPEERLERIRRNEQMLRQLGVQEAAGGLAAAAAAEQHAAQPTARSRGPPRPRERRPALPAAVLPARKSARQRGDRPLTQEEAVAAAATELGAAAVPDLSQATDKELEHGALLDLEQYFKLIGQDISEAVHTDGRFHGWVNPVVCERYGIAGGADTAWEAGGGGQFSFKIDKKAIPSSLKGRGWRDARAFSHTQLQKNPNSYFYRHAQGEWTEEEHRLFVDTARAHGVGDKWGLFASYLPQRVGYQCSAYYRDVIIPQGLVIDKRFRMSRNGKAVYVG